MSTQTPGLGSFLGYEGRKLWWMMLLGGLVSIVLGGMIVAWPTATIVVVAVIVAIWLFVSGIYYIIRAFGSGLSGGTRALLLINGAISIFLALFAFRGFRLEDSPLNAIWLLAVIVGVAFLFQGVAALAMSIESPNGRGWNIFTAVVFIIGGVILLVWPGISLSTLAWVTGIWLIVIGIFWVIGSFSVRSAVDRATLHS